MKVFVYFNLHKKKWSVRALEGEKKGKVILWADTVLLLNAFPKVSEAGRQRVIRQKRKNVHAGICGDLLDYNVKDVDIECRRLFYNPYMTKSFVYVDNESEYIGSELAYFSDHKVVYVND